VIRRRAKELLDTIQDTVKEHRETASSTEIADQIDNIMAPMNADMSVGAAVEVPNSVATDVLNYRLWSQASVNPSASLSTLFGSTLRSAGNAKGQTPKVYSASTSKLFGNKSPTLPEADANKSFFKDVASRIHRTLMVAPPVPEINANRSMSDPEVIPSAAETTSGTQSGPTGQVEIPFVPAAQRRPAHMVDDAIIVVGQARQKKRKRSNVSIAQDLETEVVPLPGMDLDTLADGNQSKKSYNKKRQDEDLNHQEPFDYSSVPNILDDIPTPEPGSTVRKKKKQKQSKDGVMQYGNFPAPPKAHRELKSGNQSYTFK